MEDLFIVIVMFDHKHGGQEKLTFRMKENELKKKKTIM